MADDGTSRAERSSTVKRKKKRKLSNLEKEHEKKASKSSRIGDQPEKLMKEPAKEDAETTMEVLEDSTPWRNLQLILSLQKKNLDVEKKVELAYKFMRLRISEVADDTTQESEMVTFARVILFLNDWVQSALISSEKKFRVEGIKPQFGIGGSCLDYRCWDIFKFCLDEGLKMHVSMSFSRDFLRVIQCIVRNVEIRDWGDDEIKLYDTILYCISSIFTSCGGVSNENLDLWVSLVGTVLTLVLQIIIDKLDGSKAGLIVLNLTCLVLEPFAKFLRLHPTRKNGFHDFVDRLLEPLLCLLVVLQPSIHARSAVWMSKLLKLVEEVLSQGLFHTSHIDGFLSLQGLAKYKQSDEGKPKDSKTVIKSYHRHLFDKLGKIAEEKKALALGGEGELYRLYVHCIQKQENLKATGVSREFGGDISGEMAKRSSDSHSAATEKSHCLSALSTDIRKSLFDFFVQIMEPLLDEIDAYLEAEMEVGPVLLNVHCILKSSNKILFSLCHEKVYLRVDDNSEGACANFLKLVCNKITLLSATINQLVPSTFGVNGGTGMDLVNMVAKELVVSIRYLLEIDYEVLGNDLESLWLSMFSYGTLGHTSTDMLDQSSAISGIIHLGCHIVNLYSELRQVGTSVFALCKAVRHVVLSVRDIEMNHSKFTSWRSSLYYESWSKSLRLILCSPEFRLSIYNAVKSIPEGQVSGCIRELATDLSESLQWMKGNFPTDVDLQNSYPYNSSSQCFYLQAEVFGRGLSEVYTLILDSLMVTTGNSSLVGVSLNALMDVIRPSMSILVSQPTDGVCEFLSTVSRRKFSNQAGCENEMASIHWLFLFFFRLYMSCRSLYRQAISLSPPATSKKMSAVMWDSFTAYSGNDWLDKTQGDEGYFSWILQPSASLLTVIGAISEICPNGTMVDSPLTYILNAMTLQRLVDLNRLIKSFEFLLIRNDKIIAKPNEEDGSFCKQSKRWQKCIKKLKKEAGDLTNFMMGYLPLMKCQPHVSSTGEGWDFGVAAIDKKSLPSAFWSIVCQNLDIWSMHAAKKKLKMFLSLLLQNSLPHRSINFSKLGQHSADGARNLKTVTAQEISLELLSDTTLYEEKFVCRHMASRHCRFLEESVSQLFSDDVDIKLEASPNWPEVLNTLENLSTVSSCGDVVNASSSGVSQLVRKNSNEEEVSPSIRMKYTVCQNLLNFFSWMPKGFISSKSFLLYKNCIFNLERLIVGTLLGSYGPRLHDHHELLRLFLCCRKALKHLMETFCEEKMDISHKSPSPKHFGGELSAVWLLKSILSVQHAFSRDGITQVNDLMFSLIDYTSYVFLALIKGSFIRASRSLMSSRELRQQKAKSSLDERESVSCLESSESIDLWNIIIHVAETLKEHTQVTLTPQRETTCSGRPKVFVDVYELQKLSSVIACFQGFLWGFASALGHMDAQDNSLKALLRMDFEPFNKVKLCIDTYANYASYFLHELVIEDDKLPQILSNSQAPAMLVLSEDLMVVKSSSCIVSGDGAYVVDNVGLKTSRVLEKSLNLENLDTGSICIKKSFLQNLLVGENIAAAFFLRELFIAYSALLRLNLQIKTSLSSSLVHIFVGISEILLLEFTSKAETPSQFTFVFLDGIGKFLEELGNHFSSTNPTLSTNVYARLIDLHLNAIGKCILLQGKGAMLESHETESSTKTINSPLWSSGYSHSGGRRSLDEFKSRLRTSFKVFVRKPSELHLSSAIQCIERALVGVQEGCISNYQIYTGSSDGGKVSPKVAAGIDCFDLVLETITGHKSLSMVKTDILGLVRCLFNIILHLQGPRIFYRDPISSTGHCADPDPGSVVLMCIEVLTKVFGKHALYQMDASYTAQALSIPAALFQFINQFRTSEDPILSSSVRFSHFEGMDSEKSTNTKLVDKQFSVDLYAACCRMLCTFLRHHKRESLQHLALLQASVCVLLHCLEMVNNEHAIQTSHSIWEVQEGVKFASFLRRIYEEIRQQKDVLGSECRMFLSSYIKVYSGYGPLKVGIRREIDEALRPGIYSLIDACSPDDLQYVHTVLGDGPCRSTLANLQHDYKLNFQYEGKV